MKSPMDDDNWIISDCWLACFDILGFRNLISVENDDLKAFSIRLDYEETILHLRKTCIDYKPGGINYCWFSDTFLMFTPDDSAQSYVVIESAAKYFLTRCIYSRIPIRGAVSVGHFARSSDNRAFMGKAFLDAFEYAEDQDWLGLILTPAAISKAQSFGLDPTHHDFVRSDDIPMRKFGNHEVLAFRLSQGEANFASPLLPMLHDMKMHSQQEYRYKYERTEDFLRRYYRFIEESAS